MKNRVAPLLIVAGSFLLGACNINLLPQFRPPTAIDRQRVERVLAHNPENAHAYFLRGRADLEQGDSRKALSGFRQARDLMPDFEEAWDGIGIALLDLGRTGEAIDNYQRMADRFPSSPAAHEGLGSAYLIGGDLGRAEESARRALELDQDSAQGARLMGEINYAQGEYVRALEWWNKASELSPRQGDELRSILSDLRQFVQKYQP